MEGGRLGVAGLCLDQVHGRKGVCDWAVMRGGGWLGWVGWEESVFGGPVFVGACVLRAVCVVLVLVLDCCVWWV